MADVSPHALIQSFIAGLGDFIETLRPSEVPATRTILLYALTGATANWMADADYRLTGAIASGSGNSWFVGFDTVNPASVGTTSVYPDTKIMGGPVITNETPYIQGVSIPVPYKSRVYAVNATASSLAVTLFLVKT